MKCDFCNWNTLPESIPALKRHVEANHVDLEDFFVVWRDGGMLVACDKQESDVDIPVEFRKVVVEDDGLSILEIFESNSDGEGQQSPARSATNPETE